MFKLLNRKLTYSMLRRCFDHLHIVIQIILKVPKREIFHRSDFHDFYTIKSLRVGDFGVKIKKIS